ncbi:MAG: acyl-CoA reductase [Bacteroidia bacterium]|nr:acyl-CoA reductase [Bacteroidia bacterium]
MDAFLSLGKILHSYSHGEVDTKSASLDSAIEKASQKNPWFTKDHCRQALSWWGECLTEDRITSWLSAYSLPVKNPKTVALVMAGNIPMVGFHDLLCVLLTGHKALIKLSAKDDVLLPFILGLMMEIDPDLTSKITYADGPFKGQEAVIATGSSNTARYFEYYFKDIPHIIRKNRNAVAILSGEESKEDLSKLGTDLFLYFGLGCRNVSKLYLPEKYDFDLLFKAIEPYQSLLNHHKYANNYHYYKAIYLMGNQAFQDREFVLFKEDTAIASPIANIYFEYYQDTASLYTLLNENREVIQCVVGRLGHPGELDFGQAQNPQLGDYADAVDTVEFLLKI